MPRPLLTPIVQRDNPFHANVRQMNDSKDIPLREIMGRPGNVADTVKNCIPPGYLSWTWSAVLYFAT